MRGLSLACIALFCVGSVVSDDTTESNQEPVSDHLTVILKQVNEINEDGTYTVGYEATDGTFKLETRDEEGNVEGKYGYLDGAGELIIVEYSANNATGFTSDADNLRPAGPAASVTELQPATPSPEFALEQQRHAAVLAHQARVVEKQKIIAQQRDDAAQRRTFANQRGGQQRRPVFNAAQFNPNKPAAQQFNTQNFNQDFQQFQQQQQQQQFAPRQQQQFQQQPQRPAFDPQFQQQQFQQQHFAPQQQQQFAPQQQQQFAPQQQQQFAQQQQQFAPQQQQQFAPQQQQQFAQQQFAPQQFQQQPQQPLIPTSQLTREDIALNGFSRDENQDGEIDALPAHLQPAQPAFRQPQQFAQQPQQFAQQPQQFAQQPQQFAPQQPRQFRQPAPVAPSPGGQQFFQQQQQGQGF